MTKRPHTTETRTVLRTILSAGVLAVLLLACAGTAAGATWVVDSDSDGINDSDGIGNIILSISQKDSEPLPLTSNGKMLIDRTHGNGFDVSGFTDYLVSQGWTVDQLSTGPIDINKLEGYDVFLIPQAGSSFSSSEINDIKTYIEQGGGMWLLNEYNRYTTANSISKEFGVTFNSDMVYDPTNNVDGNIDWPLIHILEAHPITEGVESFSYYAGSSLNVNLPSKIIAKGDDDTYSDYYSSYPPVVAAVEYGSGKGVFSGDMTPLHPNYYPERLTADEKLLLSNIVNWLSGHSPPPAYSVGEGAPDLAIKNHFIDAYNRNGGVNVLGSPTTEVHEAWGYLVQDFPGTPTIPGGVIMYNDIKDAAFYIHGAIWERYYTFVDKSELGHVASDEGEAAILPQGTTGRYTKFETGTIHWISDKDGENMGHLQRGESFVTCGGLDALYTSMGGTYSDLGFPVMDQEDRGGYGFCDFEGGYIEWDDVNGEYKALPYELSVKITSPNSDEIFKKGAIITFKGEIHGGTPEFGYLWIIDGNVQKEISNERNSEIQKEDLLIGEHEVKLQVYDSRGNVAESDKIEFKVVTWKIAIIPIKFLDISSNLAIDDLKERADYVVDYYYEQSYHQEYLGYKIISSKTESDRWHLINENYDPLIMECENPDQNILNCGVRYYEEALKLTECNLEQENIPSKIIGYDASMVVYPNNIRSKSYGSPGCYVKGNAPYGIWAHELGHTLFNFQDMAGDEKTGGDIDNWGLMGYGCKMNPPTPIIGYNKNRSGWLSYNDISYSEIIDSSKECPIYYLDDLNIRNEGLLRFETNPKSKVDYYIFEGRHERDNVPIDRLLDINYPLFSTGAIEGVMIYQVEDGNIAISRSLLDELFSFGVTLPPDTSKFIVPDNLKVTTFRDGNQLKLKIEEIIPEWIRIWEIKASIPSGGGGGGAGVPIENNLDVDLHVVSLDGKKVGMNYSTGRYYVQIEGVNTSGNIPSGGYEWISVPINIGAAAYVDLTPELKELLRNNDSINVEVISTFITYDGSGNRMESNPITVNINSESVDSPLILSLPINITFLPPITTMEQFNLTDGRTLPIKFTVRNSSTNEFIYDDTVNVTITNSTGHLITFFTNGTGTDSVRINSTEEQYIVNFHTKDCDLNLGETYTIHVTFGEADTLWGYAITHFTLVDLNH